MPSLSYRATYSLKISRKSIMAVVLSTFRGPLAHKELAESGHSPDGRKDPLEHLYDARATKALTNPGKPVLVIGVRNVLSNHRCIACHCDWSKATPMAVQGEDPSLSQRPYHAITMKKDGTFDVEEIIGSGDFRDYAWFCSGVPVAWDNEKGAQLMTRMVAESSDLSHIYHLPRGDHPAATDDSRALWTRMHETFCRHLYARREIAAGALMNLANELGLKREHQYFHSVLGITPDGDLAFHAANGTLEEVGAQFQHTFGARRAICFENSGSVTVLLYPDGINSLQLIRKDTVRNDTVRNDTVRNNTVRNDTVESDTVEIEDSNSDKRFLLDEPEHSLIAAPNKRRPGTAFLLFELKDVRFNLLDR